MKKTRDRLLRGASRRLLKTAFAGILAGAMVAMTAMPAFAESGMLDPADLQKIEASKDTFSLSLVFKYDQGETKKSTDVAESVSSQIKMRVYKIADLNRGSDAEDFHYVYIDGVPRAEEYAEAEFADGLVEALKADTAEVPELVKEYDQMYTDGGFDSIDPKTGDLNGTVQLDGRGLAACGVYYIHPEYPEGKTEFAIDGDIYKLQSTMITVPNVADHQTDSGTSHEITVYPKMAQLSYSTPETETPTETTPETTPETPPETTPETPTETTPETTPTRTPGGPTGGGNPPTRGRIVPPSQGSVLGASRDAAEPMPEVLGANRLPQTGQLWWPVPVLCILGLGLISSGVYRRRAAEAVH